MIIDLILDRYHGDSYNANRFYSDVLDYENIFEFNHDITLAMDYGTNEDIQRALCDYIDSQEYNPKIKRFINNVNWLNDDSGIDYTAIYPISEDNNTSVSGCN